MEPAAVEAVKAGASETNLGTIIGALGVAVLFIASKWQSIIAFIKNKPQPQVLKKSEVETMIQISQSDFKNTIRNYPEREEVQEMIKEHDLAATTKTTL